MTSVDDVQPSTATRPSRTSTATTSAVGEPLRRLLEKPGLERRGADHHAVGAGGERRLDRRNRPVAAPDLDREIDGRRDRLQEPERGRAVEGAVEVDDVKSRGPVGRVPPCELDGVSALQRDGLPSALREAHDAPSEDVDGRNHFELTC